MKLNKIFKGFILVLTILAVVACSSKKSNEKINLGNKEESKDTDLTSEEVVHQQIQKLKNNNIVYFAFDKYDLASEYTEILDRHVSFLRRKPFLHVIIEGHADERGTPEYNIALGERRANVVKIYLQSKGLSGEQISIVSYGKEKPAVLGHNELIYSKNRRAVLIY
ncbi:MAG: peptidoglycan-associated lipoprotein Pal [Arsenophonus sp.]